MTSDQISARDSAPAEHPPVVQPIYEPYPRFWRRLAAFIVDVILLGAIGELLGAFFAQQFETLGQSGRWIGVVIAGAYFITCRRLSVIHWTAR